MKSETHHWELTVPDPDNNFGFTYVIIHKPTKRFYVGKKQYHQHLTLKPLAGTKRKRKVSKPASWEYYKGSSKHLKEFMKNNDDRDFSYVLLNNYKTKGGLYYGEVKEQVLRGCLEHRNPHTGELASFNRQIAAVRFIPKEIV